MSLTASMWTSVSGLLNHGEKMNVVGNNIANVNTVAFKGSRMDFMDYVNQTVYAASGPTQVGRGVAIGAIYGDFSQGAFESSTEPTDLAISGSGYFKVVPKNNNEAYYTRAGNFRFDADGYLVDPHGYVLQGWQVELPESSFATSLTATGTQKSAIIGSGVPKDVRLASFSCEPRHTQSITTAINLDSKMGMEKSSSSTTYVATGSAPPVVAVTNPFASLFENWDTTPNSAGQYPAPLGQDGFAYQQSITVYDEGGAAHVLTIYFDKVDTQKAGTPPTPIVDNATPGEEVWEFVVTMDPAEDTRLFGAQFNPVTGEYIQGSGIEVPEDKKGLIMTGTLSFNSSGQLTDMMAYVPTVGGVATTNAAYVDDVTTPHIAPIIWTTGVKYDAGNPGTNGDYTGGGGAGVVLPTQASGFYDMSTWVAAPISSNGYPMFAANFTGAPGASEIWSTLPTEAGPGDQNIRTSGRTTELNLGVRNTDQWWNFPSVGGTAVGATLNEIGNDMSRLPGMGTDMERLPPTSTAYAGDGTNFYERYAKQDGYTYGELSSINVTEDGVLTGRYTNGVTLELFQITLYDFVSEHNLHREGGNLFTQTRESGDPTQGAANSGGFGAIQGNSLEQSNVDLAREFVQMIQTQRGFQANSKLITTTDTMLENVINMKR
ncbi:MAG: flagellar hook-basal body complex protein [Deltaproteobacteria bacterium]|nr:flagellar hook-basal body complex protein [Deltaproteobacteria bacterium]